MDDLLALMEGGDALAAEEDASSQSPLSSPQHHEPSNSSSSNSSHPSRVTPVATASAASAASVQVKKRKKRSSVETQVDSQLGIRMMERKIGSLDLLELVQTRNYHSPAALAAMPLATLNQQLVDPALAVGPATVNGNTTLYTVGVVFTNSGTKIATKGNAFCILTIGSNLQSGPTVSILLFGPAYSKYCKLVKAGWVVALESPRLIPPKQPDYPAGGNRFQDTAISFTINDERRLAVVARARDYGVCQAPIKGKNAEGQWVSNARRCTTAIDTRAGKYCFLHRKLENVHSGPSGNAGTTKVNNHHKKGTFMQQQKLNIRPLRQEARPLLLPNNKNTLTANATFATPAFLQACSGRLEGVSRQMGRMKGPQQQDPLQQQSKTDGLRRTLPNINNHNNRPTNNSILNASKQTHTAKASANPQQRADIMVRPQPAQQSCNKNRLLNPSLAWKSSRQGNGLTKNVDAKSKVNPYASKKSTSRPVGNNMLANTTNKQRQQSAASTNPSSSRKQPPKPVLDWLPTYSIKKKKTTTPSSTSTTKTGTTTEPSSKSKPARKLNTSAMGGFDGRVVVPKPSRMFAASRVPQSMMTSQIEERPCAEDILFLQTQLAQQRKLSKGSNINTEKGQPAKITFTKKKPAPQTKNNGGFFGSSLVQTNDAVQNMDQERIVNAKSRFATEADAEAYAASRRRLTELEQEESKKKNKSNQKDGTKKVVDKEWFCRTCHRRSKNQPKSCIRAKHSVATKRILNKETETKADKRLKLTSTSSQDGGLVLGAGLNWDTYRSSRFS